MSKKKRDSRCERMENVEQKPNENKENDQYNIGIKQIPSQNCYMFMQMAAKPLFYKLSSIGLCQTRFPCIQKITHARV